jgi:hypothetical protein
MHWQGFLWQGFLLLERKPQMNTKSPKFELLSLTVVTPVGVFLLGGDDNSR